MKLSSSEIVQLGEGDDQMETNKVLSALSYFSIFFAGILFPLIVWLVSSDKETKVHGKKAFLSHIILILPVPFIISSAIIFEMTGSQSEIPVMFIISVITSIVLSLIVVIWNLVRGIQVLNK